MEPAKSGLKPSIRVRSWLASDLFPMTDLVARAFASDRTWGARRNLTEIAITSMIVASPDFDPGLALVAETPEGRPLGLALWRASSALRPPRPGDESALLSLWEDCQGEVDLAFEPERGFHPWMAWTPSTQAVVLEEEGEVRAYARFVNAEPVGAFGGEVETSATRIHLFLAADAGSAAALLGALNGGKDLALPLHPDSQAAARLFPAGFKAVSERGGYAMIRPLPGGPGEDRQVVLEYCDGVESGRIVPGLICLPSNFDLE